MIQIIFVLIVEQKCRKIGDRRKNEKEKIFSYRPVYRRVVILFPRVGPLMF